ncbi:hypothetical protein B0J13DRAFT_176492 [Dactylonectria estremocensis]|uniref:Uncharacterized protein n=1 Tax=Dactylonectria estremocensis TaxID=1079267 RepID=A0A9P9JH31_9HYPO|nr:hypothetical protein B0J13DRAFT_176492 [Dactylonectria estremocensis]
MYLILHAAVHRCRERTISPTSPATSARILTGKRGRAGAGWLNCVMRSKYCCKDDNSGKKLSASGNSRPPRLAHPPQALGGTMPGRIHGERPDSLLHFVHYIQISAAVRPLLLWHATKLHGGAALLCWQSLTDLSSGFFALVRYRSGQVYETRSSGGFQFQCCLSSSQPETPSGSCELDDAASGASTTTASRSRFGPSCIRDPASLPQPSSPMPEIQRDMDKVLPDGGDDMMLRSAPLRCDTSWAIGVQAALRDLAAPYCRSGIAIHRAALPILGPPPSPLCFASP